MIVEFSVVPIGEGESLSACVAETFGIIEKCGLLHEFHSMGTNLEGDWDAVMNVIKSCRDRMLERASRVSISIKIDDRKATKGRMAHKVASAKTKMY